jgi:hypothetical protein
LYKLNSVYLDDATMSTVLDDERAAGRQDYVIDDLDIVPVSDPSMSSDIQRLTKAKALLETVSGRPGINEDELTQRMLSAINVPDQEKILPPLEERPPQGPPPELVLEQQKLALDEKKFNLDVIKMLAGLDEMAAKVAKLEADTIKALADAEAAEIGQQMHIYMGQLKELGSVARERIKAISQQQQQQQQLTADSEQAAMAAQQQQGPAV